MNQTLLTQEQAREMLSGIQEQMPVFDKYGTEVGTVKDIQYASFDSDILSKTLEFFRLPFEAQAHLIKRGYIQIDCGVLEHDRFATPDQIIRFRGGLRLNVAREELITD